MRSGYEAVIGLEVHVQLRTRSKMFCACPNRYGAAPNSLTCPVCLGLPGALPTLNAEAVRMGIALGLALNARLSPVSTFYRKQYFYADLPKGYQITQGPVALVHDGSLRVAGDPAVRGREGAVEVRIERAHLEEDAGKNLHDLSPTASLVDLNRAGVPLLEIVGAPDLRSPQEASDYLKSLHRLVVALGICDGNLEEGSFRCDANVSVRRAGDAAFGTRVEVKNLNSFRFVKQALEFEIDRHIGLLEAGESVAQETRGWDGSKGETRAQRSKEGAHDYRYFPEPDLPPLAVSDAEVAEVQGTLPELPQAREARFQAAYGLSAFEATTLLQSSAFADFYEATVAAGATPKGAANWLLGEVSRTLNERGTTLEALGLGAPALAAMIALVEDGTLNQATARETVFPALLAGERDPKAFVAAKGLAQVSDRGAVAALVSQVLAAHPDQVAQVRGGQAKLRGFLVGQIMKAGQGKVNPQVVNALLDEALEEGR
jgi:aspartyl-tRNA(Asn)/glutamyl-tRNA(Gln) amidotransferase subunit B